MRHSCCGHATFAKIFVSSLSLFPAFFFHSSHSGVCGQFQCISVAHYARKREAGTRRRRRTSFKRVGFKLWRGLLLSFSLCSSCERTSRKEASGCTREPGFGRPAIAIARLRISKGKKREGRIGRVPPTRGRKRKGRSKPKHTSFSLPLPLSFFLPMVKYQA
jgi:hypothetical protein